MSGQEPASDWDHTGPVPRLRDRLQDAPEPDSDTNRPGRQLRVTVADTVKPRRIHWLWSLRIVLGGLTLLAGREGLGKSTVAVDLAAQITRGRLDGELNGTPRSVIYVHTEDDRAYTIVPRLIAAGADLGRVLFVDAVTTYDDGSAESPLTLPLDHEALADLIRQHEVALVVLDAATSVIDGRLDGDKDRQMRQGLERIARIGQDTGAAMFGVVHFGKRESGDTGKLILGSIAWSQVARSVLAVARDEESGQLVVSATKGNLAAPAPSLAACIESHQVPTDGDGPADVGRVRWLGETDRDARDLLAPSAAEPDSEPLERDEADEWLRGYLNDPERGGSAPAGDMIRAAKRDGIAERTLQRARKAAGITSRKSGKAWIWELPPEPDPDTNQGASPEASGQGANGQNELTSEDAKAPTSDCANEPWRLGALASSEDSDNVEQLPMRWVNAGRPA